MCVKEEKRRECIDLFAGETLKRGEHLDGCCLSSVWIQSERADKVKYDKEEVRTNLQLPGKENAAVIVKKIRVIKEMP